MDELLQNENQSRPCEGHLLSSILTGTTNHNPRCAIVPSGINQILLGVELHPGGETLENFAA